MKIYLEEIDGAVYGDILLTPEEIDKVLEGEIVDNIFTFKRTRHHLGVALQGKFDDEE